MGWSRTARGARRLHPMAKKFPIKPLHPERNCWGCDKYCPANSLICGNGSERTQHPSELFGDDWAEWGTDPFAAPLPTGGPAGD
jgi:hypothetical protein